MSDDKGESTNNLTTHGEAEEGPAAYPGSTIPAGSVTLPYQMWRMLQMHLEDTKPALGWSGDGLGVVINESRFKSEATVLYPGILDSNNVGKFKRRLNSYGFRCRRRTHDGIAEVWHPFFHKDMDTELLKQVVHNDKSCNGLSWAEDVSEVEDHMEDTASSDADYLSSVSVHNMLEGPATHDTDVTVTEEAPPNLPVLEQVRKYEPPRKPSEPRANKSNSHCGLSKTPLSRPKPALRECFSANDASNHSSHSDQMPLAMLMHPPKAEADSSDSSWRPTKKKSSDNDADIEDNPKDEKPMRKRSVSPRSPIRRKSPVKTNIIKEPSSSTTSPYKATIDKYYSASGRGRRRPTNQSLWAEEDRSRQELERQQRHSDSPKRSPKQQAQQQVKEKHKDTTGMHVNHSKNPLYTFSNDFSQQQGSCYPSPSFVQSPTFVQSPSALQVNLPMMSQQFPMFPQSQQVVLLPFVVTPQGYEPLIMPGGGMQVFPSSTNIINNMPSVPYYTMNPTINLPNQPHSSPSHQRSQPSSPQPQRSQQLPSPSRGQGYAWTSSSQSDVSQDDAPPRSPARYRGGDGRNSGRQPPQRVRSPSRSPPPKRPSTSPFVGGQGQRRRSNSTSQAPGSSSKKPVRKKRRRSNFEEDTECERQESSLQSEDKPAHLPSPVRSCSNHSLTDQSNMLEVVSKVTRNAP